MLFSLPLISFVILLTAVSQHTVLKRVSVEWGCELYSHLFFQCRYFCAFFSSSNLELHFLLILNFSKYSPFILFCFYDNLAVLSTDQEFYLCALFSSANLGLHFLLILTFPNILLLYCFCFYDNLAVLSTDQEFYLCALFSSVNLGLHFLLILTFSKYSPFILFLFL